MDKKELAVQKHNCGYNCCQAVACAFAGELGVDEKVLYKMCEGFGAGMGDGKSACGALSGAVLVAGMRSSSGDLENAGSTKRETYKRVSELKKEFKDKVGEINCCDIKSAARTSCAECIRTGVEIVENVR